MKNRTSLISLLIAVSSMTTSVQASNTVSKLQGPWFGQKTPGMTPELFAPDLVSVNGRYEFGMSFSADLKAMYFTALEDIPGQDTNPEIYYSIEKNGYWQTPQKANFTKGEMPLEVLPYASINDNKVYFTARKPESKKSGVWYVSHEKDGFSEAKRLELALNTGELSDMNQSANGDLIFSKMKERKMYYAKNSNGKYAEANAMDIEFGFHGFISPTQDYLLVNARNRDDKNRKDSDLFVYFKEQDGSWSKPFNLGSEINSEYSETVPRITPDGKFLFFGRYNEPTGASNIYWVSTDVIAKLKEKHIKS